MKADKVRIPEDVKGVRLDEKQKQALAEGKPVFVEGMTSKNGKPFDAYIQVNADKRGIEFRFDSDRKREQSQKNEQEQPQNGEVRISKTLLGVELSDKRQGDLKAGQTVYVSGMTDKKGEEFSAYIKVNPDKGKPDFFRYDPDKAKKQGAEVIPDSRSKMQVAVNSEGKTNEATKDLKEPLKQGQTKPTERQAAKKEVKKSKGMKI
jgi:hypothetical protein